MRTIRFSLCGAGRRGKEMCERVFSDMKGVELVAIADVSSEHANCVADIMLEKTGKRPNVYLDYKEMFEKEQPEAVFIASSWESHKEIATAALRAGIAVALEVGGIFSESEWFEFIDVCEETKTPFMFMENCCFGKEELLAASLKRNGVLGEISYCHGAYQHDCREIVAREGSGPENFRLHKAVQYNRDAYPTHELGPIAKILDINRGNRMVSLTSRASKAQGLADYVNRNEKYEALREFEFKQGDIVETLISCENGELINIRYDTYLPCFYSRELTVRGTLGLYDQKLELVLREGWMEKYNGRRQELMADAPRQMKIYEEKYLPERWRGSAEELKEKGHGGMDYLQFEEFFSALREGRDMPIDVYDAATWMSIVYLSEKSIAEGGASVPITDFTRGAYKTRKPLDVMKLPEVKENQSEARK